MNIRTSKGKIFIEVDGEEQGPFNTVTEAVEALKPADKAKTPPKKKALPLEAPAKKTKKK